MFCSARRCSCDRIHPPIQRKKTNAVVQSRHVLMSSWRAPPLCGMHQPWPSGSPRMSRCTMQLGRPFALRAGWKCEEKNSSISGRGFLMLRNDSSRENKNTGLEQPKTCTPSGGQVKKCLAAKSRVPRDCSRSLWFLPTAQNKVNVLRVGGAGMLTFICTCTHT